MRQVVEIATNQAPDLAESNPEVLSTVVSLVDVDVFG